MALKKTFISDEKRLVRGEHWIFVRSKLRARDRVHHRAWKILMIAGPSPQEEIACLRELMPSAHITAVDLDQANIEAARTAGADSAICCDISKFIEVDDDNYGPPSRSGSPGHWWPPKEVGSEFDAICLDLTGPANDWLAEVIAVYYRCLTKNGVLIVTFSYGRDVVEFYQDNWNRAKNRPWNHVGGSDYEVRYLLGGGIPEQIAARIYFLFKQRCPRIRSVIQYSGNSMPMVSVLLARDRGDYPVKFIKIESEDFELAVTSENLGNIYACPQDRILELRRSMTAKKAVRTRRERLAIQGNLKLLTHHQNNERKIHE